ncbi:MAG TPA: hypothetical protein VFZ08_16715 [Terriglobia bacterium]|nr:hypothetical protein [Terriglobia bacterium]
MKTKFLMGGFAAALVVAASLPWGTPRMAMAQARQIPSALASSALPQQPAALAGMKAPTIPPEISSISPAGMRLGTSQIFTVEGRNLGGAKDVLFDAPGFQTRVLSVKTLPEKARKIRINVDLGAEVPRGKKQEARIEVTAASTALPGIHWFRIQTPLGTSNMMAVDTGALPEIHEKKGGDSAVHSLSVNLPATLVGTISAPGNVDRYQFRGGAQEEVVFHIIGSKLGSTLRSVLTLRDSSGKQLAQTGKFSATPDATLTYKLPASGQYSISVSDQEQKGDKNRYYRLYAGALPYITSVFPLGIEAGRSQEIAVRGVNLGGIHEVRVNPPKWADGWTTVPVRLKTVKGESLNTISVAVDNDPQIYDKQSNNTPAEAQAITLPATINGDIRSAPDGDYFRFTAKKDEHLTMGVAAARLGSPLDPVIEVLDNQGRPIPRALVRCLNETSLTLSDRDSRTRGLRFVSRTGFHENDYVMIGEELDQIQFIPDQPDADILMKGFGGLRVAMLGTSPAAHYVTEPIYRAEVLKPGAKFPPNGLPVFTIDYRNDDGGPGYGSDSRLDFVAPQDGQYLLHIKDVRGLKGPDFAYQLTIHDAVPDFTLAASPENPNIPRGGRMPVTVTADRMMGYYGPIEIKVLGLPKGVTANDATIPAGQEAATVILQSSASAPEWETATAFKIEGRARVNGREVVRVADAGSPLRVASIMPAPDLRIAAQPQQIVLRPGQTTQVTLHVSRENGFKGRVPCDVANLPPGVRVVNVGLNGVLVHSNQSAQTFTLKAESWAKPISQPIYIVGEVESNSPTKHASAPIILKVEGKEELAAARKEPSAGVPNTAVGPAQPGPNSR